MTFYSQVIKYAHMFKRRLIECSKEATTLNETIRLSEEARKDIKWWYSSIKLYNGVSWFPKEFNAETAVLLFTDASDIAAAAVCQDAWTVQYFQGEFGWLKDKSIAYRELYAVVLALGTFGHSLYRCQVLMNIDNKGVQQCVSKGSSRDKDLMALIRVLYYYAVKHSICYEAVHVYGHRNGMADSLSRNRIYVFRHMHPSANTRMSRPCRVLIDF